MVAVGFLVLVTAGFVTYLAFFLRWVDCSWDSSSECSTHGLVQLGLAAAGLGPALGTLVETFRSQGRPGRWLLGTVGVYLAWLFVVVYSL
jgi:hypothetical protein